MKIYFSGSVHNKGVDLDLYRKIVEELRREGHKVQAGHILNVPMEIVENKELGFRKDYYKKLIQRIEAADAMVCETSYPSTINIGHEITLALDRGKPILALYLPEREPRTLLGIESEKFTLMEYTEETIREILSYWLEEARNFLESRFTMILTSKIKTYLNEIAKSGTSRSDYIRNLILKDMKKERK